MIYLNLPVGKSHGWGVCGKYIARELSHIAPTCLLTDPFTLESIGDELEFRHLSDLIPALDQAARFDMSKPLQLDGPLLQLANKQLQPMHAPLSGQFTLGYTFFEDTELLPAYIETARRHFDRIATGSTWCTEILRRHGLDQVETVLQGIDPSVFFPVPESRQFFVDRFVVFSGGKFEFRKGQDLVIRAFKALQDRHPDVMLVTAWDNQWDFSFRSMRQSPHIRFEPSSADVQEATAQVLLQNGIDLNRVILLGARAHHGMAQVYRNTDVGLFPNRAEGGTNLVLMEYMACGKPVIATNTTGHADVVCADHAVIIDSPGQVVSSSDGKAVAHWPEPDLEQAIEKLEWAYQHRTELKHLGEAAGRAIESLTWERSARAFLELLERGSRG